MFSGFTDKETFTAIPDSFFHHLLNEISDVDELKITLYSLWRVGNMEGHIHALREHDYSTLLENPAPALEKATQRGTLIRIQKGIEIYYFLNSPRGRAAAETFGKDIEEPGTVVYAPPLERPNIFKLYEENLGPLTPMIADILRETEKEYPEAWISEALEIAVKNNKRNWKYVEAILKRWKENGHAEKQNRPDSQENGRRYSEGEFAEYLKRDQRDPG